MGAFSLMGLKLRHSRWLLRSRGLQPVVVDLDNGCRIHCWAPSSTRLPSPNSCSDGLNPQAPAISTQAQEDPALSPPPSKPALLFLHGFGANGTIAWDSQVPEFCKHFALYLPDLLFFGDSTAEMNNSSRTDNQNTKGKDFVKDEVRYSEIFQAECVHEALSKLGVKEAVVVGHSYGGFVGYFMAHLYPSFVKRLVIVSSGIMMDSHTNDNLLREFGASCIHDVLVPPTLAQFKKSFQFTLNGYLPNWLPSFIFKDMYEAFSGDRNKRLRLVDDIVIDKEDAPPLPIIEQSTLIIWGDEDQIFNITLAYKLQEFLGSKAKLQIIKGASHVPQLINSFDLNKLILSFVNSP